ncbi:hypothetical protein IEN85_12650 [Pelagicoccus sp. NFK12]|uniref:Uncharacterized protein n=1 Tax=Pelagicoccus enzymogenes TaxID=2773457 RepID=A0A927II37_9BACT|nr:hypothetical protein [Pelagicoccus enzymogenes]MBD5780343.1 hypothetical protein [Pelagicoccus enzymogenes]
MGRNYIEKRVIKAGIALCERRIDMKGTPITADDLKDIEVKTFSPVLQGFYIVVGLAFAVFGIWVQIETRSMIQSILPVLFGVGNVAFALHGRPRKVREMEGDLNLMDLTAEIVQRFVSKMDPKSKE